MTRRFEIGPLLIALAAIVLLVALFLRWYGAADAWDAFEITDLLLAVLAVTCIGMALALIVPELPGPTPRPLPWLVAAVVVIIAEELINPPPTVAVTRLGAGAWIAFGSACVMALGALLTVSRVSLAVAVEGREVRRHIPVVDHRDASADQTAPTAPARPRPSEPLLGREETETTEEA